LGSGGGNSGRGVGVGVDGSLRSFDSSLFEGEGDNKLVEVKVRASGLEVKR